VADAGGFANVYQENYFSKIFGRDRSNNFDRIRKTIMLKTGSALASVSCGARDGCRTQPKGFYEGALG